jgi:hypothetical protein
VGMTGEGLVRRNSEALDEFYIGNETTRNK